MRGRWVGGGESQDKHCVVFFFLFLCVSRQLRRSGQLTQWKSNVDKEKIASDRMGAATQERNTPSPQRSGPRRKVEGDADRKEIATRQKTPTSEKETRQISIRSPGISLQRRSDCHQSANTSCAHAEAALPHCFPRPPALSRSSRRLTLANSSTNTSLGFSYYTPIITPAIRRQRKLLLRLG